MAIGVFGLQVAYRLKRIELMSVNNTHGWFGGGSTPTPAVVSTVDRIDFSNDTGTANIRGSFSLTKRNLAATGNLNYGWFGGGITPTPALTVISTIDRIDFSNDFATASVRGPLSFARESPATSSNSNYGWFGGGFTPVVPTIRSTVNRIDFSNDSTTSSPRGPLSSGRYSLAATGNSNYGWFGGGKVPTDVSTIDRIDFSNDAATASVRGPLSSARSSLQATGNSNYGWFGGGFVGVSISRVDRIDFSNDSITASIRGSLSSAKGITLSSTGNSNYGWFGGGFTSVGVSIVDRIDFSNDSATASIRGSLSSARFGLAATSGQAKGPAIKISRTLGYGWFGAGISPTPAIVSAVERIDFSNDAATASIRGPLSSSRYNLAATGNSNYGWFGGGRTPTTVATIDRINFSNDLSTASTRGSLSSVRRNLTATGNSNYGWFGGGAISGGGSQVTTVDRVNFSNDSVAASPRGPLSSARYDFAATGNSNYGWFGGGRTTPYFSTVDRINFSNDLSTASTRSPLNAPAGRTLLAATGNSNYGWFGGGYNTPISFSTVDRIDFSNDLSTVTTRGPLTAAKGYLSATGNSDFGWFGGGFPGPSGIVVDRIDFSNDFISASPRGSLTIGKQKSSAATSNITVS
jgi:hypothetical protein